MSTPTPEQFYNKRGQDRTKPDIAFLKNHFYREGRLTEDQALWIIERGTDVLKREPNVLEVEAPITGTISVFIAPSTLSTIPLPVCGDIHGQYVSYHWLASIAQRLIASNNSV